MQQQARRASCLRWSRSDWPESSGGRLGFDCTAATSTMTTTMTTTTAVEPFVTWHFQPKRGATAGKTQPGRNPPGFRFGGRCYARDPLRVVTAARVDYPFGSPEVMLAERVKGTYTGTKPGRLASEHMYCRCASEGDVSGSAPSQAWPASFDVVGVRGPISLSLSLARETTVWTATGFRAVAIARVPASRQQQPREPQPQQGF